MKDREAIFNEYMTVFRKKEKENSKNRGEKVRKWSLYRTVTLFYYKLRCQSYSTFGSGACYLTDI